jgi:transposase
MGQRHLALSNDARAELIALRDTGHKAYLRERAAALLKIADGIPAAVVARSGLLRSRKPDTVYRWLDRYETDGIPGLTIRAGRGRKPAFFRHRP